MYDLLRWSDNGRTWQLSGETRMALGCEDPVSDIRDKYDAGFPNDGCGNAVAHAETRSRWRPSFSLDCGKRPGSSLGVPGGGWYSRQLRSKI